MADGYNSAEIARLQAILGTKDQETQDIYSNVDMTQYNPDAWQVGEAPARLTDIPTSSLDASRPRTVAAGYDHVRQVMTVMFRDGTLINYYDVTPGDWQNFHNSISKGRPWLNKGYPYSKNARQKVDGQFVNGSHRYGPADLSNVPPGVLEEIYRIARTAQVRFSNPRTKRHTLPAEYGGGSATYSGGYVPKVARTRGQFSPRSATSRNLSASTPNVSASKPRRRRKP